LVIPVASAFHAVKLRNTVGKALQGIYPCSLEKLGAWVLLTTIIGM
jgi:hypothetical protein